MRRDRIALTLALATGLPCFAQEEVGTADITTLYGRVYLMAERVEAKGGTTPVSPAIA